MSLRSPVTGPAIYPPDRSMLTCSQVGPKRGRHTLRLHGDGMRPSLLTVDHAIEASR